VFGIGAPELVVIGIVAILVFGPEKLPEFARQAGRFLRTVRQMADNAKNDLGREFGQDFSDMDLRELDPREYVRKNLLEGGDPTNGAHDVQSSPKPQRQRPLRPDERPPFDPDAT